jgi:hypothetical protein
VVAVAHLLALQFSNATHSAPHAVTAPWTQLTHPAESGPALPHIAALPPLPAVLPPLPALLPPLPAALPPLPAALPPLPALLPPLPAALPPIPATGSSPSSSSPQATKAPLSAKTSKPHPNRLQSAFIVGHSSCSQPERRAVARAKQHGRWLENDHGWVVKLVGRLLPTLGSAEQIPLARAACSTDERSQRSSIYRTVFNIYSRATGVG